MVEVKQQRTESETIARRQRNSGDTQHADTVVKGERTPYTNIHRTRNQQYGDSQPRRHSRQQTRSCLMSDDAKKPEDEIAALKARVEELERANKPPEPFKPMPFQKYDPTERMSMPPSALREMLAAEPRGFMQGVVRDNQAPQGRPGAIPSSGQASSARSGGTPGDGTGWSREIPLGPSMHQRYVDAQLDAADAKDRRELIEQSAREQALLKAAERK